MRSARLLLAGTATALALALPATPAAAAGVEGVVTHRDTRAELAAVDVAATAATAAAPDALPYGWCGDATVTDNTAQAAFAPSTPRFKLVYAHPADRPDRFAGWSDALQADIALIQRFLASQTGGAKALRIDMGTACGPQYVDLQVVHLSGPRSQYADNFNAIVQEVATHLGTASGPRNVMIVADTLNGAGYDYGLGEVILGPTGDQPDAANVHNRGGFSSVLFTRDGQPAPGDDQRGWWPEGMLHEMTHNLGAVQWGAPHSTQPVGSTFARYGHCWQGNDVMCYTEDAGAAHAMVYDCPRVGGAISQVFDCGRDDYFNPAPAAGSYLTTHWNVYNSDFMAACGQIAPACGGGMAGLAPSPPVSTGVPQVTGTARRGTTLTAVAGTWRNGPLSYRYRWQHEFKRGRWANVAGATHATYVPTRKVRGRRLRVQVVATNPDGSASAASRSSARVADGMVGHAQELMSRNCRATGRARRTAARCRGRRTSARASLRPHSRSRRTSGAAPAT